MILNMRGATRKLQQGSEQAYHAAALAYWSPRMPYTQDSSKWQRLVAMVKARNRLGAPVAVLASNVPGGVLTEADWCIGLSRQISFEEFALAYFPSIWSLVFPVQRLDLANLKSEVRRYTADIGYEYSPEETLRDLVDQIKRILITPDQEAAAKEGHCINVLSLPNLIGSEMWDCGEQKMLISNNGRFDPKATLEGPRGLIEAVVNDLKQLALDLQSKVGIPKECSLQWWMAQPDLDQFLATLSKYRSLTGGDKSYAPGIKATLAADIDEAGGKKHRLCKVPHSPRFDVDLAELERPLGLLAALKAWASHYLSKLESVALGLLAPFKAWALHCLSKLAGCCKAENGLLSREGVEIIDQDQPEQAASVADFWIS